MRVLAGMARDGRLGAGDGTHGRTDPVRAHFGDGRVIPRTTESNWSPGMVTQPSMELTKEGPN